MLNLNACLVIGLLLSATPNMISGVGTDSLNLKSMTTMEGLNPTAEFCSKQKVNGVLFNFRLLQVNDVSGWKQSSYTIQLYDQINPVRYIIGENLKETERGVEVQTNSFRGHGKVEDHSLCLKANKYYSFKLNNLGPQILNQEIGVFVCSKFISVGENVLLRTFSNGECSTFNEGDFLPSLNILSKSFGGDGRMAQTFSMSMSMAGKHHWIPVRLD